MTVKTTGGTAVTKTQVYSNCTEVTPDEARLYKFNGVSGQDLVEHYTAPGHTTVDGDKRVALVRNQVYTRAQIEALFPPAKVESISPNSGPAAGGTVVTIKGHNLTGVTAVTFGGTAGTALTVVNSRELRVTTPAGTAGAVDVVLTDDSGTVTVTDGYTYE